MVLPEYQPYINLLRKRINTKCHSTGMFIEKLQKYGNFHSHVNHIVGKAYKYI